MPNASELFMKLADKIAPPQFYGKVILEIGISDDFEIPLKFIHTLTGEEIDISRYLNLINDYTLNHQKASNKSVLDYLIEIIGDSNRSKEVRKDAALLTHLILLNQEYLSEDWEYVNTVIKHKHSKIFPIPKELVRKAIDSLIKLFKNNDAFIQEMASDMLIGREYGVSLAWTLDALLEKMNLYRVEVKSLIEMLHDDEHREFVISRLGEIRNPIAVEPIIKLLNHDDEWTCFNAVKSLGNIGDPRAVKPLINLIEKELNSEVCSYTGLFMDYVIEALDKIGSKEAIEFLIDLFEDNNQEAKIKSACALALRGNKRAIKLLEGLLDSADIDISIHPDIIYTLMSIKCSSRIINKLIEILKDRQHKEWGAAYFGVLFNRYPDIVKNALVNALKKGEIDEDSVEKVLAEADVRTPEAYLQYLLKKKKIVFSYIPSLTFLNKVSDCCKAHIKIGEPAITIKNKGEKSIHSLSCPEIKPIYWSY